MWRGCQFGICFLAEVPLKVCIRPKKNPNNNSSEKRRVRECGGLTGKRDFAYLVNLWYLVHLGYLVHLLDIRVFMCYNENRGVTFG